MNSEDSQVFQYRDYRAFLAKSYEEKKKSEYGFSYRSFARRVGSTAPNYLKLVTDGQRNLTQNMAARFAQALDLKGDAASYFCDLVTFNQAASALERQQAYERMVRYRGYREAFRLDASHAEYHSEWYIPAIRELVKCGDFVEDPKWIAQRMKPAISQRQASHALKVLLRLGLISRNEQGALIHDKEVVSTGDDQPLGHHIMMFHRTMLERAASALDEFPREKREIAGLTLSLSPRQFRDFKRRLYEFRQELIHSALDNQGDEAPSDVVQVSFQMFPLTAPEKASKHS